MDDLLSMTRPTTLGGQPLLTPTEFNWAPVVDVRETGKGMLIHAELPGVKKEDINIELRDNMLTLSGKKSFEKKEENEQYRRLERSYGSFSRSITVPEGTTEKDITARYDNGVLEVCFPKPLEQQALPKKITIA